MANDNRNRVGPLSDMNDFKVASDDPDVRGWDVISGDGRRIGEVEDLIVDTGAMKVRYLDVEVDEDYRVDRDHRVLIPIGQAQLHEREDHVHVNGVTSAQVRTLPRYSGEWNESEEATIRQHYGDEAANYDDSRFYGGRRGTSPRNATEETERMTLSEEEMQVRKERHDAGEMRVGKHVETEHVSRDVPVEREVATVERHRLDPEEARHAEPSMAEDEIRMPLHEEEATIEKRTVPKEELVVRKERVTDTEHVETDLRREQADIEDHNPRRNRG